MAFAWGDAAGAMVDERRRQRTEAVDLEQALAERAYKNALIEQAKQQQEIQRQRMAQEQLEFQTTQDDRDYQRRQATNQRGVIDQVGQFIRTNGITAENRPQIVGTLMEAGRMPTQADLELPGGGDPFTLGPGQKRFAPDGSVIAEGNEPAASASGFTLAPGSVRYGADGQIIASRPAAPAAAAAGPTPTAALNATRQLRNDFVRETASARTVQQQLALMKSSLQAVQQGREAPGSQGVLVTFQKILDPTSVVRESEYARSASGLSLLQNLEGRMMRITQGGAGVTPAQLAEFVQLAEQFAINQARFANETKGQIDAMASKFGLDPALITREFDAGQGAPAAPAATGAPKQGDTKTFPNGKRAVFDGKGWVQQ
jgi:hypothetical protein